MNETAPIPETVTIPAFGRRVTVADLLRAHPGSHPERCLCCGAGEIPFFVAGKTHLRPCAKALAAFRAAHAADVAETLMGARWIAGREPESATP